MNPSFPSFAFALMLALPAHAAVDEWSAPHVDAVGQEEYRAFLLAPGHSAFAIAPGGAYGWVAEKSSGDAAEEEALQRCRSHTRHKCVIYGVDGKTAFDAQAWSRLWGPYLTAAQASRAPLGRGLGQRFPDLAFADRHGRRTSVRALRGKVAVLHFWGSWCAPCRREMPDMQKAYARIGKRKDVALVLLQVRESFDVSQNWVKAQGIQLPLFDSGSTGDMDDRLQLSDGGVVRDRAIASRFPTTYVLDKNGIVVFYNVGPLARWAEYEPFISDVAERTGR